MDGKNQTLNNRANMFYDERDFEIDANVAQECVSNDSNFVVVLYRIDRIKTNYDVVYGETKSDELVYQPPIELKVLLTLSPATKGSYNKNSGSLRYEAFGNLEFTVLEKELKLKNTEITYGDIVGLNIDGNTVYFSVSDANYLGDSNQMLYNIKRLFRRIKCVVIDKNDFKG